MKFPDKSLLKCDSCLRFRLPISCSCDHHYCISCYIDMIAELPKGQELNCKECHKPVGFLVIHSADLQNDKDKAVIHRYNKRHPAPDVKDDRFREAIAKSIAPNWLTEQCKQERHQLMIFLIVFGIAYMAMTPAEDLAVNMRTYIIPGIALAAFLGTLTFALKVRRRKTD